MSLLQTINYDNAGNFTFDSSLIEFVGSVARLKKQVVPQATFAATYTTDVNGVWGDGVLAGTAVGGAAVVAGKLDLTFNDLRYVQYDGVLNTDLIQTGAIKVKYYPNYNGFPATNRFFQTYIGAVGNQNLLYSWHDTAGRFNTAFYDSTGTFMFTLTSAPIAGVLGVEIEIEVNFDVTAGASNLIIDGTVVATNATTGTRGPVTIVYIGTNNGPSATSNFSIADLILFSEPQHTAGYVPGYTLLETEPYPITNPTVLINTGVGITEVTSYLETATKPVGSELKYTLVYNGSDYWLSGGVFVTSNGSYAESNLASELIAQLAIGNIDVSPDSVVQLKAFLNSDSLVTPEIETVVLGYNIYTPMVALGKCILHGYIYDNCSPVSGATISFKSRNVFDVNGNFVSIDETATTDATGYFDIELSIAETPFDEPVDVIIEFTDALENDIVKRMTINVPNLTNASLESTIVT